MADHVTVPGGGAPPPATTGRIVGRADDGRGVEAMVVEIAGTSARPDGSRWHITWSLEPGRQAKESNDVIAAHGWTPLDPVEVKLLPGRW